MSAASVPEPEGWGDTHLTSSTPYSAALLDGPAALQLIDVADRVPPVAVDVQQWMAEPSPSDHAALGWLEGPVLDVGCGPGRMLRAARDRDVTAAGVDLNPHAVSLARAEGGIVYEQSVFDPMPGPWTGFLLLDGNIGIGGDPLALLRRLGALADRAARLLVETDRERDLEVHYRARLCDDRGLCGDDFAWSRVGAGPLRRFARSAGWRLVREDRLDGRHFCLLSVP